jgi:hypothetical protein
MATFKREIELYTSIPDTFEDNDLKVALVSSVLDVNKKILEYIPEDTYKIETYGTSNVDANLDAKNWMHISDVRRKQLDTPDGLMRSCEKLDSKRFLTASDTASLFEATADYPVYTIRNNDMQFAPTLPTTSVNGALVEVYGVKLPTTTTLGISTLSSGDTVSDNFLDNSPSGKYYNAVFMHVAILICLHEMDRASKSLLSADTTIWSGNQFPLLGSVSMSSSLDDLSSVSDITEYVSKWATSKPSGFNPSELDLSNISTPGTTAGIIDLTTTYSATAPAYTAPSLTLSSLTHNIANLPTVPTLSWDLELAPIAPQSPNIIAPTVSPITIDALPTAPVYTPPVITTTGTDSTTLDLTKLDTAAWTAADYDFDDENIDPLKWFQLAGDFIQNEEDPELAQAQLQKISTYIQAYQAAMQSRLHTFNDQNVDFQAGLQRNLEQARINMQDAQKEADLTLQATIQDYTLELQRYQTEIQEYGATVNQLVQKNQGEIAAWQTESSLTIQLFQAERTTEIQKYTNDIGNALNVFNKENVVYQAGLQVAIEKTRIDSAENANRIQEYGIKVQTYQAEVNAAIQEWVNGTWNVAFLKYQQDFNAGIQEIGQKIQDESGRSSSDLQRFQAEIARLTQKNQQVIAEYTADIQEYAGQFQAFNALLQEKQLHYNWHIQQYTALQNKYNEVFGLTAVQQQEEALSSKMAAA